MKLRPCLAFRPTSTAERLTEDSRASCITRLSEDWSGIPEAESGAARKVRIGEFL